MQTVKAGDVTLGWRAWGEGDITVLFVHGNLASKDWIELAAPLFPRGLRVIGVDWRGCGDSERPPPTADYANYSMQQHAQDMIAALDALRIGRCHLATHSTGGIISTRMLLLQPERFGRVLALDPVSPLGMAFEEAHFAAFRAMRDSLDVTRAMMAVAAASLFTPESLAPGAAPRIRDSGDERAALFERIVQQTFTVGDGIWLGTPYQLNEEHKRRELAPLMPTIQNEHLVLWGEQDVIIPQADLRAMAAAMPHCRLVTIPGIGHSMNLERPALYAGYFGAFFAGQRL